MHKYSKIEDEFLIENVKGITLKELTYRFNKKFRTNVKERSIANRKVRLKIRSGIVGGQFKKGNIPFNKGTKGIMKANKTSFKKGNIPKNYKPIGYERINKDGYIEIKIKDPNVFKLKHRYLYEQKYGKIPKGYKLIFADKNKQNLDINNLVLVTDAEELIMNNRKLISKNKELTKTGAILAKVIDKTNKRRN